MFAPRLLRPLPRAGGAAVLDPWSPAPFTMISGPVGTAVPEQLATALADGEHWQDCVWLRPDPGATPATTMISLVDACRHRWTDPDRARPPGAGCDLAEVVALAPSGAVVVLELGSRSRRAAREVVRDLRAATATRDVSTVVIHEGGYGAVGEGVAVGPATDPEQTLPYRHRERLRRIAGPRRALIVDVVEAAAGDSRDAVLDAIASCHRPRTLLDRVAGAVLDGATVEAQDALRACLATGYWHPHLATAPVPIARLRPWVVPLEDGWGWLRPMWRSTLEQVLARLDEDHLRTCRPVSRTAAPAPATDPGPEVGLAPRAEVVPSPRPSPLPDRVPDSASGPATATRTPTTTAVLDVRLLGEFEVRVDGVRVDRWRGQKGLAVLRFLIARPRRACARDALIGEFWPDVAPEVARNRLQVAVSGLRRSLRDVTRCEVVAFGDGEYRIHPDVRVDLDVDRFEAALRRAGIASGSGSTDQALEAYREAIGAYRGDFAADAPFETWTLIPRESHRLSYVDALDGFCRLQLGTGRLDEAIHTGHRMLEADPCREDAHRLLMDCYRRLGRPHQVARQYELCARVLRTRLDVDPDPATTRLYRTALATCTTPTRHDALGEP